MRGRPQGRLDSMRPLADSYAMASGTDLDRLADFVTSRRVELSMDVEELAQHMGVSDKTVRRIETGVSVKRDTYAKLEVALGWTAGSARRVLANVKAVPDLRDLPPESDLALAEEADRLVEVIRGVLKLQDKKMTPRMVEVFLDELGRQIMPNDDNKDQ
jgi:transcriptional regulator with XRE-family HTH domain